MAHIEKRINKNGEISFRIKAFAGYDASGKQNVHSMTWKPDAKLTQRQVEREVILQAADFLDARVGAGGDSILRIGHGSVFSLACRNRGNNDRRYRRTSWNGRIGNGGRAHGLPPSR